MSAKALLTMFSAGAGAYSQDPLEHPFAAIAGAAIGGYVGAKTSGDVFDTYKRLMPNKLTVDAISRRRVDVSAATDTSLGEARKSIATRMNKVISNPDDYKLYRDNLSTMIDDRFSGAANTDQLVEKMESYLDEIGGDKRKMLQFKDILSNKNKISTVTKTPMGLSSGVSSYIKSTDSVKDIKSKLRSHYQGIGLTNPREKKALVENLSQYLHGRTTAIEDYTMTMFADTDRPMKMQLTGINASGQRMTVRNDIAYMPKSISPYGGMYADNVPLYNATGDKMKIGAISSGDTIGIATKYRAEELPALVMQANSGSLTDDELRALAPIMEKSYIYSANDVGMHKLDSADISGFGKRIGQTLEFEDTIQQYMEDGVRKAKMIKMNTRIEGGADRSQNSILLNKLQDQLGINPLHGQNTSALTGVTVESATERLYSPGFFMSGSRQQSYVNYREVQHLEESDSKWLEYKKEQYKTNRKYNVEELQRSAAHGERIQISSQLAEIAPNMFGQEETYRLDKKGKRMKDANGKYLMRAGRGNTYAIADGHGLLNAQHKSKFAGTQNTTINIADIGDELMSKYNMSFDTGEGMASIEDLMSMDETSMQKYLRDNEIMAKSGEILGYDAEGKALGIKKYFTKGRLNSVTRTEAGLALSFTGMYTPKDWVKIFGTSSKSGLTAAKGKDFAEIGAVSLAEARGYVTLEGGKFEVGMGYGAQFQQTNAGAPGLSLQEGTKYSPEEFLSKFRGSSLGEDLMKEASKATMIQRWEDIGQEGVEKLLLGGKTEGLAFAEELQQSIKGKDKVFDKWASEIVGMGFTRGEREKKVAIYQTMLSMSDDKSTQDMFLTIAEDAAVGLRDKDLSFLHKLEEKGIDFSTDDKNRLRGMFESLSSKAVEGKSITQFTTSLGEGSLGSGSTGSLSWLEHTMLKSTGFDKLMLGDMTELDRAALQELHLVQSVYDKGAFDSTSFKGVTDEGRFMHDLIRTDAENRRYLLESKGVKLNTDATSASYILKNRAEKGKAGAEKVLSIPVGFEDTNYSGMKEYAGREMLFEVEQIRSRVIQSDIALSNAGSAAAISTAKSTFQSNVEDLINMQSRMMSGDNDLRKAAARRTAKNSNVMLARPIGGTADTADSVLYVSKGYAKRMYQKADLNYKDFSTTAHKGKGLMNLHNQYGQDLYAQVSREPVQGPFSSMGFRMMVDTSLADTGDHVFIPQKNELLNKFAFLDYDADHLRMMSALSLSEKQTEDYIMRNKKMESGARRLVSLQSSLGVKGGFKELNIISQFDSMDAKEKHMLQRGELGGLRKTDSAAATTIVLELNKALDIEGSGKDMYLAERVLAHNLTENLLKSSHKSDASVLRGSVQDILTAQTALEKGGSEKQYSDALYNIMNETLGGKFDSMSEDTKGLYKQSLRSLADIGAKRHLGIKEKGETFLDKGAGRRKNLSTADAQRAMIEYAGMQGGEGPIPSRTIASDGESIKRAARSSLSEAKAGIGGVMSRNKGLLAVGAAGLFGLAMMSRDIPDQMSATSPSYSEKAQPLQPLPDQKGYIRQYSPNTGMSASASVRTSSSNMNPGTLDRALFGDNIGKVSVNVTDKSGMF